MLEGQKDFLPVSLATKILDFDVGLVYNLLTLDRFTFLILAMIYGQGCWRREKKIMLSGMFTVDDYSIS